MQPSATKASSTRRESVRSGSARRSRRIVSTRSAVDSFDVREHETELCTPRRYPLARSAAARIAGKSVAVAFNPTPCENSECERERERTKEGDRANGWNFFQKRQVSALWYTRVFSFLFFSEHARLFRFPSRYPRNSAHKIAANIGDSKIHRYVRYDGARNAFPSPRASSSFSSSSSPSSPLSSSLSSSTSP